MDVVSEQMLPELEEIDRPPGPGPGLLVREADDYLEGPIMSPRLHHNNFISLGPPPPVPLMEYQAPDQTSSNFTQTFLRGILTSIDSKDPVVANAWLETLLDAIDLLPIEVIKQEIIIIAINKSQLSQPPFSRIASCKILGKLSTKLDQQANRQEILPSSLALCQDVEAEVRNVMCRHLAFVARGVGLELTKSAILPVLVELSNDEGAEVRLAAIETVVHLLSLLDDEVCTNTIVPLVMKSCGQARTLEDCTLPVIARHLGRLCHGLSPNLSQEQKSWFISFYQQLAKLGTDSGVASEAGAASAKPMPDLVPRSTEDKSLKYTECRQACAYNLPGMVLFVGAQNFSEKLFSTFCDFAADSSPAVRKTLAASLHELIKIIGTNFCLLKMQIVALFNDNNMDVLSSMVFNMVYIIDGLARFGVLQFGSTSGYSQELSLAILHMEEVINNTRNWRLHADCLEKLSCLANCISAAVIQHRYIPLLFTRAHKSRPLPTRTAAVRTLLVILRFTVKQEDRNSIMQRIKSEFARGKSSHSRMLYLKMSEMAICLFSKLYFKQNFFTELLCLSQDPVANIRLKVVSLLPQLKGLLVMPGDSGLLLHLEDTIKELLVVESDRDVLGSLQTSIQHLAEVETALEGISKLGLYSEEDIVDDRKLREEKLIANMEEQIKQVQGAKFEQLMSPSAIPSRLRSLGAMERKRSESLPPALNRPEATGARPRYSSPEPQMLRGGRDPGESEPPGSSGQAKLSSYSPVIWSQRETETFEEKDFKVKTGLSTATPFSSSLENLDTQEFLVDAGIKLPSAASLPNLSSVGKTKDGLIRSNSIPDNSSSGSDIVDGELAKYLISNEEMEHYEAEYHKAAQEVQIDPSDLGTSLITAQNNNETTASGTKARGRSESRMRPPSFTSALINRTAPSASATVESITISKSPVSFSKPIPKAEKQEASLTPPTKPLITKSNQSLRNSPPKLDERVLNQQPRWNDGSIERLAEKWAAKRDALLKETGVIGENLQQRKAEMEQKLESVKRSIPKRSFATASKRLSLVETSSSAVSNKETSRREPKRKSLDADVVLKDAESDEEVSERSRELPQPPAPAGLVRKLSPEAGSSDSDDSLPPYPAMMDKQNLDVDKPLPPPPELSNDSGFHNSGRESKLKPQGSAIGTGSRLQLFSGPQSSSRSSMATFKKVSAPQTSVAVSRQLQAPKRSIADSPKLPLPNKPPSDKLSPPSKLNANTNRNSSSDAKNLDELKPSEANKNSSPDMKTTINTVNHQSQSKMNDSPSSNLSSQSSKIKLFNGAKKPSEDYSQQSATSAHPSSLLQINRSPNKRVPKAPTTHPASGQFSSFKGPNGPADTKTQARGGKTVVYIETNPKPSSSASSGAQRQESKLSSLRSPSLKSSVSKSDSNPGQNNGQLKTFQSKLSQRGAALSNGHKSKSSSPSGSCENLLSPSNLNPGLGTKTVKSGLIGPRRSSGVRLWPGKSGPSPGVKQLQPPSANLSRSPSPSLQRGPRSGEAVASTLPRGSASRMRAPASTSSQQRRSYGGVTASPGMMRSGLAKHSSAPNTPRHSQADLSGGRSPGGSRSSSPVILRQPRQQLQQPPPSSDNQFRNPAPSSSVPVSRFSGGSSMLRRPSSSSIAQVQHDDRPARPSSYSSRPSGLSSSSLSRPTEPSRSQATHHNQQQSLPATKSRLPNPPKSFGYSY